MESDPIDLHRLVYRKPTPYAQAILRRFVARYYRRSQRRGQVPVLLRCSDTSYLQFSAATRIETAHTAPAVHGPARMAHDPAHRANMLICFNPYREFLFLDADPCARPESGLAHQCRPLNSMWFCFASKPYMDSDMCQLVTQHLVEQPGVHAQQNRIKLHPARMEMRPSQGGAEPVIEPGVDAAGQPGNAPQREQRRSFLLNPQASLFVR